MSKRQSSRQSPPTGHGLRLSRIHPYPAMVSDQVAVELAAELVRTDDTVLDPFCGTSRTLVAAAELGAHTTGLDVNPLAVLISRAKFSSPALPRLKRLAHSAESVSYAPTDYPRFEHPRKVSYFSPSARGQLVALTELIDSSSLDRDTLLIAAAVLSATARDASVCRQDSWKLHRIPADERQRRRVDARVIFARRLERTIEELSSLDDIPGSGRIVRGSALNLGRLTSLHRLPKQYDLVVTSPPYGDSYSTVHYGGMSSICLGVLDTLRSLRRGIVRGCDIDRLCLGGADGSAAKTFDFPKSVWNGERRGPQADQVGSFLWDLRSACGELGPRVRRGGRIVMIVGRRSVGGWRVNLDRFIVAELASLGFQHEWSRRRRVLHKWTPWVIDAHGRGSAPAAPRRTMRWEYIVCLKRP